MKTSTHMQYGRVEELERSPSPSGVKDHTPMLDRSMIQGSITGAQTKKGNFMMKRLHVLFLGLLFASTAGMVSAQGVGDKAGTSMSREQIKKERDEFMRTHQYDNAAENWVLKPGVEPPAGMKPRAAVKAEREEFLRNNRYDGPSEKWVSLKGTPRDLSTMPREQLRAETNQFIRTHRWDPVTDTWVEQAPRTKK